MNNEKELKISKVNAETINKIKKDQTMFSTLVTSNRGFIQNIVRKFNVPDTDFRDDLEQEGFISLWKAIDKFNTERADAASFSTFAYRVIYNDILQAIKKRNRITTKEYSLENQKRSFNESEESASEYRENKWKNRPNELLNMEDIILDRLHLEDLQSQLSEVEKRIYKWRIQEALSHKEAAKKCKLNFHTYKLIYYTTFRDKMRKLGIEAK